MSREVRSAWVILVTAVAGYVVYAVIVVSGAVGTPLPDADYIPPMLIVIGAAILVSIVLNIVLSIGVGVVAGIRAAVHDPDDPDGAEAAAHEAVEPRDERDRAIGRYAEYGGQAFLVIGALAVLVLAFVEADHFWIANAVFLAFTLSAALSSILRLTAYRWGMPA